MTNFLGPEMLLRIPALLLAITFHEYAHARVSYSLGDPTPKWQGRLSLNPLAHLDPIGLLMLWLFKFGWAKPVEINPNYYKEPKKRHDVSFCSRSNCKSLIGVCQYGDTKIGYPS